MGNRPLTPEDHRLARWLLEHGNSDAASFLTQLEKAEITPNRCECGCASIGSQIRGLLLAMNVQADEGGTPAEAKAMLEKAVAHYKAVGRKQALADFNTKKAPFSDRDLYVFCIGPDRLMVANGAYPSWVGQPVDVLKDASGKALGKSLMDAAAPAGIGVLEYPHINPVSHRLEVKVGFV